MSHIFYRLTGEQLQEDDRLRHEVTNDKEANVFYVSNQVDRLAQDFSLASKEESVEAIGIGEQMLELMHKLGFSPSVTWPGYLRLTELLLKVNKTNHLFKCVVLLFNLIRLGMCQELRSLLRCPMAWSAWLRARRARMPAEWLTLGATKLSRPKFQNSIDFEFSTFPCCIFGERLREGVRKKTPFFFFFFPPPPRPPPPPGMVFLRIKKITPIFFWKLNL